MGHRALVAVEARPGRYTVFRSQWAGLVLTERSCRPDEAVAAAVADGTLVSADRSPSGVLDALDARDDEALFVVSRDGTVERYLVVWLGLVLAGGTAPAESTTSPGAGAPATPRWTDGPTALPETGAPTALIPVADPETARQLDASVRVAKGVLGDAVDAGVLSPAAAVLALSELLARHPDVPPETLWFPFR